MSKVRQILWILGKSEAILCKRMEWKEWNRHGDAQLSTGVKVTAGALGQSMNTATIPEPMGMG